MHIKKRVTSGRSDHISHAHVLSHHAENNVLMLALVEGLQRSRQVLEHELLELRGLRHIRLLVLRLRLQLGAETIADHTHGAEREVGLEFLLLHNDDLLRGGLVQVFGAAITASTSRR
ncbi:hypothetical protein D3C87_1447010 [compost metagenome]